MKYITIVYILQGKQEGKEGQQEKRIYLAIFLVFNILIKYTIFYLFYFHIWRNCSQLNEANITSHVYQSHKKTKKDNISDPKIIRPIINLCSYIRNNNKNFFHDCKNFPQNF